MQNNIKIRLEKESDYKYVENLVRESFWNVYRPGCIEHFLLHELRKSVNFVKKLDFVMKLNNKIIGQVAFVKSSIKSKDDEDVTILTLGPICIANEYKRKGYGKILLDYSINKACELGYGVIFLEGNIDFYGKSGFNYASTYNIKYHGLSDEDDSSFFLCLELKENFLENIKGEYFTPEAYLINEEDAFKFDESFPKKEKLKLPGQLF